MHAKVDRIDSETNMRGSVSSVYVCVAYLPFTAWANEFLID